MLRLPYRVNYPFTFNCAALSRDVLNNLLSLWREVWIPVESTLFHELIVY